MLKSLNKARLHLNPLYYLYIFAKKDSSFACQVFRMDLTVELCQWLIIIAVTPGVRGQGGISDYIRVRGHLSSG